MKVKRKRKIAKLIKPHAISLMNEYFNNEHTLAVFGVSVISDKRELEISETLSHYAHILYRNFYNKLDIYNNEWANSVLDFY